MKTRVFIVSTVELVERHYAVQFTDDDVAAANDIFVHDVDDNYRKEYASELVGSGEINKFTEGNANIEDIFNVEEQK